jgi:hypothetical protein
MIIRDFTNGKKQEMIEQIKEVGEDRPWEQPPPLSFPVPDEIYQPFRAAGVFYNSLVDKNIQTVGEIEKIWTEVQRLDDEYGNRLKNIQAMAENLNAKIALIDRAIGTNLASALSQAPSTFLAGIDEINEKIFNNKVDIEYSKLVSRDEKGNLVYNYDAMAEILAYYLGDDAKLAALKKAAQEAISTPGGGFDEKRYENFVRILMGEMSKKLMFDLHPNLLGFISDGDGKWHSSEFAWQKAFGFGDILDVLHGGAFCSIESKKFIFEYDVYDVNGNQIKDQFGNTFKLEYRFENWLGEYGTFSIIDIAPKDKEKYGIEDMVSATIGGECGLYARVVVYNAEGNPVKYPGFTPYKDSINIVQSLTSYSAVIPPLELPTTTYVYPKGDPDNPILMSDTRDYAINDDDWWNYAVVSNKEKLYKEDLGYKVEYEIRDPQLADAFMKAALSDPEVAVSRVGDIITVDWIPTE